MQDYEKIVASNSSKPTVLKIDDDESSLGSLRVEFERLIFYFTFGFLKVRDKMPIFANRRTTTRWRKKSKEQWQKLINSG